MSKTFKFEYIDFNNDDDDLGVPYPLTSEISAEHTFADGSTWDVILWQFCKFLESTGYVGITDQVKLVDKYGTKAPNMLFECINDTEDDIFADWADEVDEALDRRDGDAT